LNRLLASGQKISPDRRFNQEQKRILTILEVKAKSHETIDEDDDENAPPIGTGKETERIHRRCGLPDIGIAAVFR
jgi:hypothetical protein